MSEGRAETVDFRLAPLRSESEEPPPRPMPQPIPTAPKELLKLIRDLSAAEGLEQLVSSTSSEKSFRYENYKERSDFLRGLTLNFPNIASLRRSVGFVVAFLLRPTRNCVSFTPSLISPSFLRPSVWARVWRCGPSGLWRSRTNQGTTTHPSPRFALWRGFMATLRWALSCCWSLLRYCALTTERTRTSPR